MHTSTALLVFTALSVSNAGLSAPDHGVLKSPSPSKSQLLEAWSAESFALPPGFAPTLPKGKETLRFAPGWRKPGDEGFWSYAFVMWIEDAAPDAKRIDALLETYYNGILGSFAGSAGKDISKTPARVEVKRVGAGRYEATMNAIDAFATFKPIKIRLFVETVSEGSRNSSLRIQLSPQPKDHAIWTSLRAAIVDILAKEKPKPAAASAEVEKNPMAPFGRLMGGRWKTSFSKESYLIDTWAWGPGRHSVRSLTEGIMPNGDPWHTVTVYFWHPAHQGIRWLTASAFARGIGEGTFVFDGTKGGGDYDLFQTWGRRPLAIRWAFDGPDKYHHDLLDRVPGGYEMQNPQVRHRVPAAVPGERVGVPATGARARPSAFLKPLEKLLGATWETDAKAPVGRTRTAFEYVPDSDVILGRVVKFNADGTTTHLTDLYLYHHTGKRKLCWLALSGDGAVAEGDIVPMPEGKSLKISVKEHRATGAKTQEVRLDFQADGTLRQRVWKVDGAKRTPMLDVLHKKAK